MGFLCENTLESIRNRAAHYDATNTFFDDDLTELRDAGYLAAFVPTAFGGSGLSLQDMTHEQMALAGAAPATALAINMHHVWVGVARAVHRTGDSSMDFVLEEAAHGELFAFGVSEAGNDLVLFGSNTQAIPHQDGSYTFHGTKIFTSLSPAWTRLGTFGVDTTDPNNPMNVWGFVDRDPEGVTVANDWDTLGMRASHSCTTHLHGALAPATRIVRRLPPGPSTDPMIFAIFSTFEILLASVYTGVATRALDLAIATARTRTSKASGTTYDQDPAIRWRIADAAIALDAIHPQIRQAAQDLDAGVDRGPLWYPQLSAIKTRATETALDVVNKAIRVSGGSSYFTRNELSRLYRDVLAGLFHPSDDESVHNAWATALLGPLSPA